MDDLISKRAAIAYACSGLIRRMEDGDWRRVADIREDLQNMPSAEPERKTGKKIVISYGRIGYLMCDQCGEPLNEDDNYCSNCGCKMEVDNNE